MNDILAIKNIPKEFRRCKIIAILKPNKEDPSSCRPIALLSGCYKLLEKLLYNRIYDAIDRVIPPTRLGSDNEGAAPTKYISRPRSSNLALN